MKKQIEEFFVYRHRFKIGYLLLAITFMITVFCLSNLAPKGLSQIERDSLVASSSMNFETLQQGNIVDFPYYAVQHLLLNIFGLNFFSIKLPTVLFAIATGIFIIILLNRHFKNVIALITAIMSLFSVAMLFVSTNGSPLIMYPFWLSLIIWLGSKLINQKKPNIVLAVCFVASLIFSLYTPYMIYFVAVVLLAGLLRPHVRYVLHKLKPMKLALCLLAFLALMSPLVYFISVNPYARRALLVGHFSDVSGFYYNIQSGFSAIISLGKHQESIFLTPMFNLAVIIIAIIGLLALCRKIYTAYSLVILSTLIFSIIATGLDSNSVPAILVPITILTGIGISVLVKKWYQYFPYNTYARFVGLIPLAILTLTIIVSNFNFFVSGYSYAPSTVHSYNNDLSLLQENISNDDYLLITPEDSNYAFYSLVAQRCHFNLVDTIPDEMNKGQKLLTLHGYPRTDLNPDFFKLKRIITSSRSENSDRLYIYE